jgi:hypothetical protein
VGPGRERQALIYTAGLRGRKPTVPTDARRLEQAAQEAMSPEAFAYFAGGAGLETTMATNRRAFTRRAIVPRVLRGAPTRDLSVELLGRPGAWAAGADHVEGAALARLVVAPPSAAAPTRSRHSPSAPGPSSSAGRTPTGSRSRESVASAR